MDNSTEAVDIPAAEWAVAVRLERMHLEIFEALNRTGSLTRAAEELHLTQSALSHNVRKLESVLGERLWTREGRKLRLTDAGTNLLAVAQRLLPQIRNAEETLDAYGAGRRGKLRIGVECHPCYEYLVGLIDGFLRNWPEVEIDVTREFQFDGLQALLRHEVDLVVSPDTLQERDVRYVPILDFELRLMVPEEHPFTRRRFLNPEDLSGQTLLTYPIPTERLDVFTQFLIPAGVRPLHHVQVEATEIMMQLVAAGRGVSTFPDWLIDKYRNEFHVAGIRLGRRGIQKNLWVVTRDDDRGVAYLEDFIRRAREQR